MRCNLTLVKLFITKITDTLCLALKSCEGIGGFELDLCIEAENGAKLIASRLGDLFKNAEGVGRLGKLDSYGELIGVTLALNDDLVVRSEAFDGENDLLDLTREDVYAAYFEHIVGSARKICHTAGRSAALAFFVCKSCYILGSVTDKGKGFLFDAGDNQLAPFALGVKLCLSLRGV